MSMPRQRGMRRDGHFERCELRLSRGIVGVRFSIPGLRSLQQDVAVAARYVLRSALSKQGRQRCCDDDGSCPCDTGFRNHVDRLLECLAVTRFLVDLELSMINESDSK